jgi:CBS domain containing-hemolysin-like protein
MKEKTHKEKKDVKETVDDSSTKWFISIFIITFILSLFFSYVSSESIQGLPTFWAVIILVLVIFMGIFFDIVAVAVTIAREDEFHAKATKKVKGSKTAIKLIRNSDKVSNFCADVIGDIAGVLSGAIGALISFKITESYGLEFEIQFFISALIAAVTVGGKAIGKGIARKYTTEIVAVVSKILNFNKK